jgi:hypothetical protein
MLRIFFLFYFSGQAHENKERWLSILIFNGNFNTMTAENDLVLIYMEDMPLSFARIESILADYKPDWYHVKLLLLQIPPQIVTWILRDIYINGSEFTMQGKRMRLEKIVAPPEPQDPEQDEEKQDIAAPNKAKEAGRGKVISLSDLKKK